MNYNILAYILYFSLTAFIILKVGWMLYTSGEPYLREIYPENQTLVNSLNTILLIGYYLLNLGYVAISLSLWPTIDSVQSVVQLLANKIGLICLILGVIHFANMVWVRLLKRVTTNF